MSQREHHHRGLFVCPGHFVWVWVREGAIIAPCPRCATPSVRREHHRRFASGSLTVESVFVPLAW